MQRQQLQLFYIQPCFHFSARKNHNTEVASTSLPAADIAATNILKAVGRPF